MKIRKAMASDLAAVERWLSDPLVEGCNPASPGPEAHAQAKFWTSNSPHTATFIAEEKGKALGIAICIGTPYHKADHWNMLSILVDPKKWGKGIGTALLQEAEKFAKDARVERFVVELFENPAEPWFIRRGFSVFARGESALKTERGFRARILLKKEALC